MSVPLLHFVFGRAGNIVPVKIYASVAGGTAEHCGSDQGHSSNCMLEGGPGGVARTALGYNGVGVLYAVFEAAYNGT